MYGLEGRRSSIALVLVLAGEGRVAFVPCFQDRLYVILVSPNIK